MRFTIAVLAVLFAFPSHSCGRAVYTNDDASLVLIMFNGETDASLVEIRDSYPRRCNIQWNFGMRAWIGECKTGDPVALQFFQEGKYAIYDERDLERFCF